MIWQHQSEHHCGPARERPVLRRGPFVEVEEAFGMDRSSPCKPLAPKAQDLLIQPSAFQLQPRTMGRGPRSPQARSHDAVSCGLMSASSHDESAASQPPCQHAPDPTSSGDLSSACDSSQPDTSWIARTAGTWSNPLNIFAPCCPQELRRKHAWRLSDFEHIRELGRGFVSSVSLCRDVVTQENVALKKYKRGRITPFVQHQIDREVRIHASLEHPNIVPLYGAFESAVGDIYLVMKFAAMGSVYNRLRDTTIHHYSDAWAVPNIMIPFLSALDYLHARRIVHRDVKPENMVIGDDGVLMLADFGLSIDLSENEASTRVGTPAYMAPELLTCGPHVDAARSGRPSRSYDYKIDCWAAGTLAFELLTGQTPFFSPAKMQMEHNIRTKAVEFPVFVSSLARSFIGAALAKLPASRPSVRDLMAHSWILSRGKTATLVKRGLRSAPALGQLSGLDGGLARDASGTFDEEEEEEISPIHAMGVLPLSRQRGCGVTVSRPDLRRAMSELNCYGPAPDVRAGCGRRPLQCHSNDALDAVRFCPPPQTPVQQLPALALWRCAPGGSSTPPPPSHKAVGGGVDGHDEDLTRSSSGSESDEASSAEDAPVTERVDPFWGVCVPVGKHPPHVRPMAAFPQASSHSLSPITECEDAASSPPTTHPPRRVGKQPVRQSALTLALRGVTLSAAPTSPLRTVSSNPTVAATMAATTTTTPGACTAAGGTSGVCTEAAAQGGCSGDACVPQVASAGAEGCQAGDARGGTPGAASVADGGHPAGAGEGVLQRAPSGKGLSALPGLRSLCVPEAEAPSLDSPCGGCRASDGKSGSEEKPELDDSVHSRAGLLETGRSASMPLKLTEQQSGGRDAGHEAAEECSMELQGQEVGGERSGALARHRSCHLDRLVYEPTRSPPIQCCGKRISDVPVASLNAHGEETLTPSVGGMSLLGVGGCSHAFGGIGGTGDKGGDDGADALPESLIELDLSLSARQKRRSWQRRRHHRGGIP